MLGLDIGGTDAERELREKIDAEAEAFEADPNPDAVHYVRHRRPPRDPVYTLRLPRERIEQLRAAAEARGMDAITLARHGSPSNSTPPTNSATEAPNAGSATYAPPAKTCRNRQNTCVTYSTNAPAHNREPRGPRR